MGQSPSGSFPPKLAGDDFDPLQTLAPASMIAKWHIAGVPNATGAA